MGAAAVDKWFKTFGEQYEGAAKGYKQ
jgi:hypothetical protein